MGLSNISIMIYMPMQFGMHIHVRFVPAVNSVRKLGNRYLLDRQDFMQYVKVNIVCSQLLAVNGCDCLWLPH